MLSVDRYNVLLYRAFMGLDPYQFLVTMNSGVHRSELRLFLMFSILTTKLKESSLPEQLC